MTKKIGIIIGIILMMSFLSGLSAIRIHIHNVWVGTNDDLKIHCTGFTPGWQTLTIKTAERINEDGVNYADTDASVMTASLCTIWQGDRSVTFTLPSESSGINEMDVTLPGPWQELPLPIEEK